MIKEYDLINLDADISSKNLKKGDVGAVVAVYDNGGGYEVEFVSYTGKTIAVETLLPNQVQMMKPDQIMAARSIL